MTDDSARLSQEIERPKGIIMETEARLTRLAKCAGCGAKVGAGTLVHLLDDFKTRTDPNLIVGFDKSDDASVYVLDEERALVQTTDFFPPIVDDPYMYGQIAAANAISDVYAMGGEPKLALNIMCLAEEMDEETIRAILKGGYDKAYEAGVIITGGHTIHGSDPIYGLAVSGFVHPNKVLTNSGAKPGDVLILTKPLGIGILTTGVKADLVPADVQKRIYTQMATLNKAARDIIVKYPVHSCTDVTGFALMGHTYEMANGSDVTIRIDSKNVPFHPEAEELSDMGFIPAGAYRNRDYVGHDYKVLGELPRWKEDIFFDPQTSGGLLVAIPEKEAEKCLEELKENIPAAAIVGYVTEKEEHSIVIE